MMSSKEHLMKCLQMYDFVIHEACLFLDTHPDDKKALEYFNKYSKIRDEVQMEYTQKYGTVDLSMLKNPEKWDWVQSPWPWENEED